MWQWNSVQQFKSSSILISLHGAPTIYSSSGKCNATTCSRCSIATMICFRVPFYDSSIWSYRVVETEHKKKYKQVAKCTEIPDYVATQRGNNKSKQASKRCMECRRAWTCFQLYLLTPLSTWICMPSRNLVMTFF